jgi:L-2-hydroxyglutarate oxidase LhgO
MDVRCCIIGAGVVGLAIARKLSETQDDLVILERHVTFGQETSSRNSEVIHSGIYYPEGSLKARLCLQGNDQLYAFCTEHGVSYNRCGKLIISQSAPEEEYLHHLLAKGRVNGVKGVRLIGADEIAELEPNIRAEKALWIPSTGIVDSHGLMKKLHDLAVSQGVQIALRSDVRSVEKIDGGYRIHTLENGEDLFSFTSRTVINCAGLESGRIAASAGLNSESYRLYFCKGEYFRVKPPKNKLVNRLIYPTPFRNLVGLGIHATIELDGGLKLGPNALYLDENRYDYQVNADHRDHFFQATSGYLPFLEPDDLVPEMAGLRPKLQPPGAPIHDFLIQEEKEHGLPGFYNLVGIESPGLTSSLAIADYVYKLYKS